MLNSIQYGTTQHNIKETEREKEAQDVRYRVTAALLPSLLSSVLYI